MMRRTDTGLLRTATRVVLGYFAYVLSVPAILLQAFTLFCGVAGVLMLVLAYDPGLVQTTLISLLTNAGLTQTSYTVNPVPSILRWHLFFALLCDVFGSILQHAFPRAIPSARQLFIWTLGIDAVCSALFGFALLLSGKPFWPSIMLLLTTIFFTSLAFVASHLPRLAR